MEETGFISLKDIRGQTVTHNFHATATEGTYEMLVF
jgi:hypothetical protein